MKGGPDGKPIISKVNSNSDLESLRIQFEVEAKKYQADTYLPWGKEEEILLREYYGKLPLPRVAELLGRSYSSVSKRARVMGLRGSKLSWVRFRKQ